jgi:xylulokinase
MPTYDNKYILTIDLGIKRLKVALVSTGGKIIGYEYEEIDTAFLPKGGAEQNPNSWWLAIFNSVQRLVAAYPAQIKNLVALSCTSPWSSTVAVDQAGNPLMNAIIQMDTRGESYIKKVMGGGIQSGGYAIPKMMQWLNKTGGMPDLAGKNSLAHILYIKNELPEIYKKTYKFLEPKDYLNLKLTGKFAASYDSITQYWVTDNRDIDDIIYDDTLIKTAMIDGNKLPELKPSVDLLGILKADIASELGLPKDIPIVMGTPDIHSAAIGSGAGQDFQGHIYLGSTSWISCHLPYKKADTAHKMATLPSPISGRYFLFNEEEAAGISLEFLKDNILYSEDELLSEVNMQDIYKTFDNVAEKSPAGSGKLIFTPWLNGKRIPIENDNMRGGFHNMTLQTTRAHLIRAVFEGVTFNSKWALKYVEEFIGQRMDSLNIIGGGANSALWCQIYADILDRKIHQVKDPSHAKSRGAALLASVALGYGSFQGISEQTHILATFHPNQKNREIYDELYDEFLNIYKQNKGIYARLNGQD